LWRGDSRALHVRRELRLQGNLPLWQRLRVCREEAGMTRLTNRDY